MIFSAMDEPSLIFPPHAALLGPLSHVVQVHRFRCRLVPSKIQKSFSASTNKNFQVKVSSTTPKQISTACYRNHLYPCLLSEIPHSLPDILVNGFQITLFILFERFLILAWKTMIKYRYHPFGGAFTALKCTHKTVVMDYFKNVTKNDILFDIANQNILRHVFQNRPRLINSKPPTLSENS